MSFFLGVDLSTQSIKAIVVDEAANVVASAKNTFDSDFSAYKTQHGVHVGENGKVTSPVLMWCEAVESVLTALSSEVDLGAVRALSVSGQQHGSVYWTAAGVACLAELDPSRALAVQLAAADAFAVPDSPVWMDTSTRAECERMERAVGGGAALSARTGSRAYERFTAHQMARVLRADGGRTARVSLVSSFAASLLAGRVVGIDCSDGSGMNALDIRSRQWWAPALACVAPGRDVAHMLGCPVEPMQSAGSIGHYWQHRLGFSSDCEVVVGTGDNPSTVAGLGVVTPGHVGVSLGTSDTVFGLTRDPRPSLTGHIFCSPVDPPGAADRAFMAMLCFSNGSLVREAVRDTLCDGTWAGFAAALRFKRAEDLLSGPLAVCALQPEITPHLRAPALAASLAPGHDPVVVVGAPGQSQLPLVEAWAALEKQGWTASQATRAIVAGHFVSMRGHMASVGLPPPAAVLATGGGSANDALLAVLAAVMACPVRASAHTDAAALGAALRALHVAVAPNGRGFAETYKRLRGAATQTSRETAVAAAPAEVAEGAMRRVEALERAAAEALARRDTDKESADRRS